MVGGIIRSNRWFPQQVPRLWRQTSPLRGCFPPLHETQQMRNIERTAQGADLSSSDKIRATSDPRVVGRNTVRRSSPNHL
ncbi:hypothetical protein TNCV_192491 [Trichonephila clavipes]|nr:hypothetical protein TNCV_192491 [Trichonephila clavipes]